MSSIRIFISTIIVLVAGNIYAQEILRIHKNSNITFQQSVENIDSLKLNGSNSSFYQNSDILELPISSIDSITFIRADESEIYIIYNESKTTIINPYSNAGVTITDSSGYVTVISTFPNDGLRYNILGTTSSGSLKLTSMRSAFLILNYANVTNPIGPAFALFNASPISLFLSAGTVNTLNDGSPSASSGALYASGDINIIGAGALNVNGYAKHAIAVDGILQVESGIVNIAQSSSDGIHANAFIQNGGDITITPTGDGIDASSSVELNGGNLTISVSTNDAKGIKGKSVFIRGGIQDITAAGDESKAIKSSGNTEIEGGRTTIKATGTVVIEASGSGFDPSYCTGIKSDADVIIKGGILSVECPTSNHGGKGISADGNILIQKGNIDITTKGDGDKYTNESGSPDSYAASCITADGNITILAGQITCSSSGKGGKGISADGTLSIGVAGIADDSLNISVTTSGSRFLVSGSGQNADYANPKAIKAEGDLTINSGIIIVNCTQNADGGEGIESKSNMYIKGGQITATTHDDCINAKLHIEVSGGIHSLHARGNDGMDSNGTLTISGGMVISKGAGGFEEGFDCDNNTFKILGGVMVGSGGNTSNPTANVSTQNSLKLSIKQNTNICIKDANNQIVLIYALPTLPTGGSNSKIIMLFSDPAFVNGTYTIQYGGTISGGTSFNGYYSNATYSGGTSQTFTVNSRYTQLNL